VEDKEASDWTGVEQLEEGVALQVVPAYQDNDFVI
jgi:hypothetical protein